MPLNQFLVGSLTSVFLANGAPASAPTLSEKAHWIKPVDSVAAQPSFGQPGGIFAATGSDWRARLAANAHHLALLPAGWDGPGSVSISSALLSRALFYVKSALEGASANEVAAPRLVPGGDGSLQIEWHTHRGELEFDLDDQGEASIWVRDHSSGAEFDGEGGEALALFYRWAPWIAAQQRYAAHVPPQTDLVTFPVAA
ncbi:hypothetical protein IVB38_08335 [Bradyrhizobium sp. 38]|jgi:hypothetical protein|uniref:hypothetical protein n=1 Tax=unclassified Bradyrhizobium TaxID=2631580 RepID=UPI001FFA9CA3|nr:MULTISPECIES: hypothetical protein [unclassified Bradyrhizobium]MCK1336039.1 hypothetical protein [Bradyrhizobium sp. 38]MCK1780226.1 hypothetical protein [Bradyrhizobium sp. 132]